MAKKKDLNTLENNGITYHIVERVMEETNIREIPDTIEFFLRDVITGKICRDPLIQRTDNQWSTKQKSKLIEAILHNRPIGNIIIAKGRAEAKNYMINSLVDGLQRVTAMLDFYQDKYSLNKFAAPITVRAVADNGAEIKCSFNIAGKKFSQLPDAIQEFFNRYHLTTYMYEGFSDDELDDIVFCLNNGKTPNAYQKLRFLLGSENMRLLQPICDSTIWEDSKGCKAKNDSILCCVIRSLMMITYYPYNNLGSASMTKFVEVDWDNYVKPDDIKNLASLVDEFAEIKCGLSDNELEKFDSITIPHYIMTLNAFKRKDSDGDFEEFLHKFWSSDSYDSFTVDCESSGSGSGLYAAESIEKRQNDIDDFIDEYFENNVKEEDDYFEYEESNEDDCFGEEFETETAYEGYSDSEGELEVTDYEPNFVSPDNWHSRTSDGTRQEGETIINNISRSEQTA